MNKRETATIMEILKTAYPGFYKDQSEHELIAAVELWTDMFKKDDVRLVAYAVKALIATDNKGFPPVIGQVKDKMYSLLNQRYKMTEGEAWGYVANALRNSAYGSNEEFAKLPEPVQRCVGSPEQLREWALMDSETVASVVASNFQRSFRYRKQQEDEVAKLPETVTQMLGNISERLKLNESNH